MELLCGVGKPQRRSGWGSAWGRASTGKGDPAKGDLGRGWGGIRRSATMPASGGFLNKSSRSSPQAYRRHLLPSTLPSVSRPQRVSHDPYSEPLCPSVTVATAGENVVLDDDEEPGELRRSQTLPVGAIRRPPPGLRSPATSLKREGSLRRRATLGRDTIKKGGSPSKDGTSKREPNVICQDTANSTQENDEDVSERTVDPTLAADSTESKPQGSVDASVGAGSPFRRTLTLPPGAICRRCPPVRTTERRKILFVHSKTYPDEKKENVDKVEGAAGSEVGSSGGGQVAAGKRHSTTSTVSGVSRLTSTTTTDEGVCVYSEEGSVTSSSVYSSVRGGTWSGSSVDEGISVYSAPSLASSADLSSVASLYERAGARPKLRIPQPLQGGILEIREGQEEESEKCLRCQREAAGVGSAPLRRARSLRTPRHLPVTPTLLKLLHLVSVTCHVHLQYSHSPPQLSQGVVF